MIYKEYFLHCLDQALFVEFVIIIIIILIITISFFLKKLFGR